MDEIIEFLLQIIKTETFWLPVALLASMILVQGVKTVIKHFTKGRWRKGRRWFIFVIAYIIGFQCGNYFLVGVDVHKWAVFIGIINPCVYFALVQYAVMKDKLILLSILKMRPLVDLGEGKLGLNDTQTFMSKR